MKTVLEGISEEVLGQECSNIETLLIKSNGEDTSVSEAEKQLIEAIDSNVIQGNVQYNNDNEVDSYIRSSLKCNVKNDVIGSQKHNQLISESSIETDEQSTNSSVTDSNSFDSEDSCDSRDDPLHFNYQNEDSFLMKLAILLTKNEEKLIDEFYQKMKEIEVQNNQERKENICNSNINCAKESLKRIKCLVDEYLRKGIKLNSYCNNAYIVTNLIFERIKDVLDSVINVCPNEDYEEDETLNGDSLEIIKSIISDLLLRGGKVKCSYFYYKRLRHATYDNDYDLFEKCREIEYKLKGVAYESTVNKNELAQNDFAAEIDNCYFYIRYVQGTIVKVARITNNQEIKDLNLRVGILQIGESVIRVERLEEKRNYTDVPQGMIKMSFTTEIEGKAEKIIIHLYPDKEDSNKIKVELDEESQDKINKLQDKSSLGKNCLLGGKNIAQAIQDQEFTKHESYKPSTFEQVLVSNVFGSPRNKCEQFGKYVLGG